MKTQRRLVIAGIIFGSILTMAPLLGFVGTAFGMMRVFSIMGSPGISDPEAMGESIGVTLMSLGTGLLLFPLGVLILTISLVLFFTSPKATPPPLPHA